MNIRTSTIMPTDCQTLWPLLTRSEMTSPGCFCLGVPRPVACSLPVGEGGVGSERQCISDRGVVRQMITNWQPPHRLGFRMVATDHAWGHCVDSIDEAFELKQLDTGTRITRTTTILARGRFRRLKEALFFLGLKRVHLYVFKNWRAQTAVRHP